MRILDNLDDCTGCSACKNVCPTHCIEMHPNKEGFLYPYINKDICINCELCIKTCPINNLNYQSKKTYPVAYLGSSRSKTINIKSASGGLFTTIALEFIKKYSGIVYGAIYNKEFKIIHARVDNIENISQLSKSKYVQSEIGLIFQDVKKDLKENKFVLFSGTPCQIYGLKSYLKKDYEKLFCIDVICHGVPSPLVYKKYLNWQRQKNGEIQHLTFRDKKLYPTFYRGGMGILFKSGFKYFKSSEKDSFGFFFWKHYSIRKSCYNCKFKSIWRLSDLTLGDCWFSEEFIGKKDLYGYTLSFVQSIKGENLLKMANKSIYLENINSEDAIKANGGMIYSSCKMNENRTKFFEDLYHKDFNFVVNKYTTKTSIIYMIKTKLKEYGIIPHFIIKNKRKKELNERLKRIIPQEAKCLVYLKSLK